MTRPEIDAYLQDKYPTCKLQHSVHHNTGVVKSQTIQVFSRSRLVADYDLVPYGNEYHLYLRN